MTSEQVGCTLGIDSSNVTILGTGSQPVTREGPFAHRDGFIDIPDEPGLGVTVNEDVVRELAYRG
jgi:L-alanine-DL-glutamate epimerase-like enolase superfamily enzyme